jgi:NodT family efflux transporter outer membrane factor (OMF) lipoprotein
MCSLPGCTVGPDYVKPAVPVPANYKEAAADGTDWKVAEPGDRVSRGKWWTLYGDSLLSALEDVLGSANQDLRVAESRYAQARALVEGTRGNYLPSVTAGVSVSRGRNSANTPTSTPASIGPANAFALPLELSWELDIWGRVRRAVESSEASAQAIAADLESARLSLQSELAVDYFLLRGIDSERQLLDRTLVAYRKAYELTVNRHEGGAASDADVAQAETQLRTAQAQAINLRVQRAQLEHAIAVLIGKTPAEFSLPQVGLDVLPPMVPLVMPSALLERRPDIASAERQMASANAQIGVAKAAFYPTISIGASAGFQSSKASNWFDWPSRFWSVGPSAALILFDANRRRALSEQAEAAYAGTIAAYRQTVLTAFQDVEDNLAELSILAEEAGVQEAAVKASRRSVAQTTNRYEAGAASYLEVVVAQTFALSNERAAVDIARRRMMASVRLIKALGGDWSSADLPPGDRPFAAKR